MNGRMVTRRYNCCIFVYIGGINVSQIETLTPSYKHRKIFGTKPIEIWKCLVPNIYYVDNRRKFDIIMLYGEEGVCNGRCSEFEY